MKKYGYFVSLVVGILMTTSCSESLTCLQCLSSPLLQITAPQTYIAHPSAPDMPVIVKNNSDSALTGISYTFSVNDAKLSSNSIPNNCSSIAANSTCQMNIPLTADVSAGTVQITAQATDSSFTSNMINFIPFNDNYADGADAVQLYGDDVLIDSGTASNDTIVTAIVGSNVNAKGAFNKIVLADANSNAIPYCTQISGPTAAMSAGNILTYLCQIPHDIAFVELAPQLQLTTVNPQQNTQQTLTDKNIVQVVNTGRIQLMIEILSATNPSSYMVQSPSIVYLNQNNQTKQITITNKGNQEDTISKLKLATNYVTIANDNCTGKVLAPKANCTYDLNFDPSQPFVGNDDVQAFVASTHNAVRSNVVVNYTGNSPIINVTTSPNDIEFITNELSPAHKNTITVTNNSAIAILPQQPDITAFGGKYFSISSPSNGTYCYGGSPIESNQNCSFDIVYNNSNDDLENSFALVLPFTYSYNGNSETYNSAVNISYITNNFAGLDIYDSNGDPIQTSSLETIHNNNRESSTFVVSLYNHGTTIASNISTQIDNSNNSLFTISNSTCQASLAAGGSCKITLAFGPTSLTPSSYDSKLSVNYNSISTPQQSILQLNGTVIEVLSANLEGFAIDSTFTGSGTINEPYTIEQGSAVPSITYQFTNIGNSTAESINVELASNSGWKISQDNCSGTKVLTSASCQIQLSPLDISVIGSHNLDLSKLAISWSDQNMPSGITDEQSGIIYATVIAKPTLSITLDKTANLQLTSESQPSHLVLANTSYSYSVTLNGGVVPHDITASVINGSGNASFASGGKCTLSPKNPTCQLILKTADNQEGYGDFTVTLNSDINLNQSLLKFHTWSGSLPSPALFNNVKSFTTHKDFVYVAAPDNIYRCSTLSNGNVYACLPLGIKVGETYKAMQMAFIDDTLFYSSVNNSTSPYVTEWLYTLQLSERGLVEQTANNGMFAMTVILPSQGSNDASGFTSFAFHKDTIYLTQFNQVGLWECPLFRATISNESTILVGVEHRSCKLSKTAGSDFQGNAASLVIGNNLYITQTVTRPHHGLNKCQIDDYTGLITNCTNISPNIPGDAQSFDGVQFPSGLLAAGGYLYGSQAISGGSDICPFDGTNITGSCTLGTTPQYGIITMIENNGWIYYTTASGSGKARVATNGTFTDVGNIVGY